MIRPLFLFFLLPCLQGLKVHAQDQVQWTYSSKQIRTDLYEVHVTANLKPGWHIYAQHQVDGFPGFATHIDFGNKPGIAYKGEPREDGKKVTEKDPTFGIDLYEFESQVDFIQLVQVNAGEADRSVTGKLTFQVCSHTECLQPQTANFSVDLKNQKTVTNK